MFDTKLSNHNYRKKILYFLLALMKNLICKFIKLLLSPSPSPSSSYWLFSTYFNQIFFFFLRFGGGAGCMSMDSGAQFQTPETWVTFSKQSFSCYFPPHWRGSFTGGTFLIIYSKLCTLFYERTTSQLLNVFLTCWMFSIHCISMF